MIPREYVGKKFLLNVEEIRYTRGGVASNQVTLHRMADEGNRDFIEDPPVITFDADADIDLERLIRIGAVTPYAGSDVARATHTPKADAPTTPTPSTGEGG